MISAIVSALHVLALALGLPSIFFRGRALKGSLDGPGLHRLFTADTVWGIAALLWLATGLARAFGGLEKGSAFYLASPLFWLKITLFATVALLEAWPMATFIRWRRGFAEARPRIRAQRPASTSSTMRRWASWSCLCSSRASWLGGLGSGR